MLALFLVIKFFSFPYEIRPFNTNGHFYALKKNEAIGSVNDSKIKITSPILLCISEILSIPVRYKLLSKHYGFIV